MKKLSLFLVAIIAILTSYQSFAQEKKAPWKELKDFHEVMAKTFHPAEEGNIKPLKENSALLLERAIAWKSAAVPAGFDAKMTASVLDRLVAKCEEINSAVKANKDDKVLTQLITEGHDVFHEIVEKCRKPENGEHNHEGHEHHDH